MKALYLPGSLAIGDNQAWGGGKPFSVVVLPIEGAADKPNEQAADELARPAAWVAQTGQTSEQLAKAVLTKNRQQGWSRAATTDRLSGGPGDHRKNRQKTPNFEAIN